MTQQLLQTKKKFAADEAPHFDFYYFLAGGGAFEIINEAGKIRLHISL